MAKQNLSTTPPSPIGQIGFVVSYIKNGVLVIRSLSPVRKRKKSK